ncbi:hypothetical protein E2C01_028353 [Portunus trituberculatus]|uniref:Uncharacterized protein n=1 Tax=Portunus trituberculatus TaxID=210409 RepID=A0A5B7ENT2_PORTR|nr:hypothetical protein [Portunus trituberculatus]
MADGAMTIGLTPTKVSSAQSCSGRLLISGEECLEQSYKRSPNYRISSISSRRTLPVECVACGGCAPQKPLAASCWLALTLNSVHVPASLASWPYVFVSRGSSAVCLPGHQ